MWLGATADFAWGWAGQRSTLEEETVELGSRKWLGVS